jgi:hypothetical protein
MLGPYYHSGFVFGRSPKKRSPILSSSFSYETKPFFAGLVFIIMHISHIVYDNITAKNLFWKFQENVYEGVNWIIYISDFLLLYF